MLLFLWLACNYYGNKITVEEKACHRGNTTLHAKKLALEVGGDVY